MIQREKFWFFLHKQAPTIRVSNNEVACAERSTLCWALGTGGGHVGRTRRGPALEEPWARTLHPRGGHLAPGLVSPSSHPPGPAPAESSSPPAH